MNAFCKFIATYVIFGILLLNYGTVFAKLEIPLESNSIDEYLDLLSSVSNLQNSKDVQCAANQYPPPPSNRVRRYTINLDLPPENRWDEVMADKKDAALVLLNDFKNLTARVFKGRLFKLIDKYLPYVARTLPEPFYSELRGVARAANITLGEITLYNIFYEVFTVCTSIVAEGRDGKLYHGRNLDFGLFLGWDSLNNTWLTTEALRPLIVELDFVKNNQTLFRSVNFAGYIGALTGIKPNLFTVTLDERFKMDGGWIGIIRWLLGDHKTKWAGFLMRNVLEEAGGYHEALATLRDAKLLAPVYFILGGNSTDQGAVITRGRNDAEVWFLGTGSLSQKSTWYLVETNYDHWKKPPFFDDRRTPAIHCMDQTGSNNLDLPTLYDVLSTRPVLNKLTTYTTLMDVSTGHIETWIQYCPDPCEPW